MNYIRGRIYLGNINTRVEKRNLRSSEMNRWFGILGLIVEHKNDSKLIV